MVLLYMDNLLTHLCFKIIQVKMLVVQLMVVVMILQYGLPVMVVVSVTFKMKMLRILDSVISLQVVL